MLLRTTLLAATAAIGIAGPSVAGDPNGPVILDDQRLDLIVAGSTIDLSYPQPTLVSRSQTVGGDLAQAVDALNFCLDDLQICFETEAVIVDRSEVDVGVILQK